MELTAYCLHIHQFNCEITLTDMFNNYAVIYKYANCRSLQVINSFLNVLKWTIAKLGTTVTFSKNSNNSNDNVITGKFSLACQGQFNLVAVLFLSSVVSTGP